MTVKELRDWLGRWTDDTTVTIILQRGEKAVHYSVATYGNSRRSISIEPTVSVSIGPEVEYKV